MSYLPTMGGWRELNSGPLEELFTVELSLLFLKNTSASSNTDRTVVFLVAHTVSPIIRDPHCSSAVSQLVSLCIAPVSFTADLSPDVTYCVGWGTCVR